MDTSKIYRTKEANTALAFVSLKKDGNRDFSFYRKPSADMLLCENEIEEEWFNSCGVFHFCSVDLIEAPVKYAHKKALEFAMEKGCIISFDPNVRLPLWNNSEECKKTILEFLPKAHVVKISDEELEFVTGYDDINKAKAFLFKGNCKMFIYTKGSDGAELYTKNEKVTVEGIKTNVIDTTGAGDSFIGAFLYNLLKDRLDLKELEELSEYKLKDYLNFANIYANNSTTKKGAIAAMATKEEIEKLMKQ